MGWNKRPPREDLLRLYVDEQKSSTEIGGIYNASFGSVCRWLAEYDIPRRSTSEAKRLDMARHSRDERMRITSASRLIITGRPRSHDDLCRRALGKQRNAKPSAYEAALAAALEAEGMPAILHLAVDKYNVDLARLDGVAIEVDGGNWHRTSPEKIASDERKAAFLRAAGWRILRANTRRTNWIAETVAAIKELAPAASARSDRPRRIRRV